MATISLSPPALIVEQLFARRPAGANRPLLAYIFGPMAKLTRYSKADEKEAGYLGQYISNAATVEGEAQTLYPWPGIPTGGVIDHDFTKLFVEKGLLRYHHDTSGAALRVKSNVISSSTHVYGATASAVSNVIDGGARSGDLVFISGGGGSAETFELATYVIGTDGADVAAAVSPAAAVSTNKPTASASAGVTNGGSNTDNLTASATGTSYNGAATGNTNETYTVTVTTPGAGTTAKLSVASLSGTDDVASVTTTALGAPVAIGTRGLTMTFVTDQDTVFAAGDTWTVVVQQLVSTPTLGITGTYSSRQNRTYIVEVVTGGLLAGSGVFVAVSSQDGTDSLPPVALATGALSLGSYGLTLTFSAATDLVKGDKWTINVAGISTGPLKRLILADDLPADVPLNNASETLQVSIFRPYNGEVSRQGVDSGLFNYTGEATQLRVKAGISIKLPTLTLSGTPIDADLISEDAFGDANKLYVQYRAWYPASTDLIAITTDTDLDYSLDGPNDSDNPLMYAVSLARLGAVGETIFCFNTGDPSVGAGWTAALVAGSRSDSVYGYVPLTQDADTLTECAASVSASNRSSYNSYRVLWTSSVLTTSKAVVADSTTDDEAYPLAIVEDNPDATGTQYTQLRLTSGNADLLSLGVRAGDEIRYFYSLDAWNNESYMSRTVGSVKSATTVIATQSFGAQEVVAHRVEIHRKVTGSELRDVYAAEASQWASDLVRHVISPEVLIGGNALPAYFLTPILAGMRSYYAPQQPLSTMQIPGVLGVNGLESLSSDDLDILAGAGAFICNYDYRTRSVRIRHGITTGETDILAKREESMVSARHGALFQINTRLAIYAGQVNLGDDTGGIDVLSEQIRSELESLNKSLQAQGSTPELGGLIRSLVVKRIYASPTVQDELVIEGELELGRPGNRIRFNVLIR
jgi:hypothetical protein